VFSPKRVTKKGGGIGENGGPFAVAGALGMGILLVEHTATRKKKTGRGNLKIWL